MAHPSQPTLRPPRAALKRGAAAVPLRRVRGPGASWRGEGEGSSGDPQAPGWDLFVVEGEKCGWGVTGGVGFCV